MVYVKSTQQTVGAHTNSGKLIEDSEYYLNVNLVYLSYGVRTGTSHDDLTSKMFESKVLRPIGQAAQVAVHFT